MFTSTGVRSPFDVRFCNYLTNVYPHYSFTYSSRISSSSNFFRMICCHRDKLSEVLKGKDITINDILELNTL